MSSGHHSKSIVKSLFLIVLQMLTINSVPYANSGSHLITLRLKFKQGEISKYKATMRMTTSTPIPGQAVPASNDTVSDMTLKQETKRLLPGGSAEVLATISQQKTTNNHTLVNAPTMDPTIFVFNSQGKITSPKVTVQPGVGMGGISSLLNGTGTSGVGIQLPSKPVAVGESWEYPIKATDIMGGTFANATLVKLETVGSYKTARIHSVVKLPIHFFADKTGALTASKENAMLLASGSGTVITDYNIAVAEGKLVRSSGQSFISMKMKMNTNTNTKSSPFSNKKLKPSTDSNSGVVTITIKMEMGMNLIN